MIGKNKLATAALAFAAMGGATIITALPAGAATPSCGSSCFSVFSQKFGPGYVVDVYQGAARANQEVIEFQASNSDKAEDFTYSEAGTVSSFYDANDSSNSQVSAKFAHTYGNLQAFEAEYSPYGVNSGYCLSTWPGEAAQPGFKVRLELCGRYANSLWAVDTANTVSDRHSALGQDAALINGATDSFSNPEVLNYPAGNPTDMPRPWLTVQPLHTYSGGTVFDSQEWGLTRAPLS